jgi:hypothetical protein
MRRTLTAIMVTALVSGALLVVATLTFEAWYWRLYFDAQAIQSAGSASDAVIVENPYQFEESAITYFQMFIAFCAAATFWAVLVVIPSLLASRRLFAGAVAGHIIAAVVVCGLSGVAFALMQRGTPYISPIVTFATGGAIGLVSIVLLAKILPPDTSLERTRAR